MLNLLLSILSSSFILVIFKIAGKRQFPALLLVILNYFSASFLGYYLAGTNPTEVIQSTDVQWIPIVLIGSIFVFTFFLIGETTKKSGIAVTTIASKMSFILPVAVSFMIDKNDTITFTKIVLIIAALVAVLLTVYKKNDKKERSWLFPLMLFVLLGLADSLVKYMQTTHIKDLQSSSQFSATIFSVSAVLGIVVWLFYGAERKKIFKPSILLLGLLLGVLNFGSLYFLVNALNVLQYNNSIVLGINNLGVVVLSVAIALVVYKEKLMPINKIGIALSIVIVALMAIFV